MIISVPHKLELNKKETNLITDGYGNLHLVTFIPIRLATKEEFIEFCVKEYNWTLEQLKDTRSLVFGKFFYEIITD